MPMLLKGSCRCGAVRFEVDSHTPVPYQLCYCSICRKQQGGGGFAINLGADSATLKVTGKRAPRPLPGRDRGRRASALRDLDGRAALLPKCGSALWLYDPTWPELVHPFASAIDSELPKAQERVHLMLKYKASWVEPDIAQGRQGVRLYPEESIADWHKKRGLWVD